jgi:hypothetical protein
MNVVKGKSLGKDEIFVCRILRDFSTVIKFGLTSTTSEGSGGGVIEVNVQHGGALVDL